MSDKSPSGTTTSSTDERSSVMRRARFAVPAIAVTTFLSAFLLFQVQPLISRYILPWFGGSPNVWTVCMLFFQVLLVAGYAYAQVTTRRLNPTFQALLHVVLLGLAVWMLPVTPDAAWKPTGSEPPTQQIVLLLTAGVGLPYFMLSTTGPLLQAWFARVQPLRSPYWLYGLSNVGSLLALATYPFLFDRWLSSRTQADVWSAGFALFAVVCGVCAWSSARNSTALSKQRRRGKAAAAGRPAPPRMLLWFCLAAVPSVLLLAVTNEVCVDIAVVPFLWVLPLMLYLLSFILCFSWERGYSRLWYGTVFVPVAVGLAAMLSRGHTVPVVYQVAVYVAGLFVCCMVCHGELVRLRPPAQYLTSFYLVLSVGGAAGGLFVGLIAPAIFPAYLELHVGLVACCLLMLAVLFRDKNSRLYRGRPRWAWGLMLLGFVSLTAQLMSDVRGTIGNAYLIDRNFYGVLKVQLVDAYDPQQARLELVHGRTRHGLQFASEEKRNIPTTYYGEHSAVGRVLRNQHADRPRRVGVVGLGVGTLAAYGRPQDVYRFYEINPEVITLAEDVFVYLSDSPARCETVAGDARISLEREPSQDFDVLVLDAFSSDAVPIHLLTAEAMETYLRHLKPDGVLAAHISTQLDLRPVLAGHAERFDLHYAAVVSKGDRSAGTRPALWVLLSRAPQTLSAEAIRSVALPPEHRRLYWSDQHSSLASLLQFRRLQTVRPTE